MDGGRLRWVDEGRPLSTDKPSYPEGNITVEERDDSRIRAFRDEVLEHLKKKGQLVDVRSPEEYSGQKTHMPEYPQEGCLRGGHIPGAKSIPWAKAIDPETHTFKPAERAQEAVRAGQRPEEGRGDHRLLPDRRAVVAHLVRADLSARLRQRAELRRVVDRVGERGAAADRAVGRGSCHPERSEGNHAWAGSYASLRVLTPSLSTAPTGPSALS